MSTLFVVATPIGNLSELSPRAIETLRSVSLIAAEDTRHTGVLLARFEINTPTISYHAFNERERSDRLLSALADGDIALVTDAGTPAISDPGALLVDAAHLAGFPVKAVAGPSSVAAAVSVSGLVTGPYLFLGFLPRKGKDRSAAIGRAAASGYAIVLFESPNRVAAALSDLAAPMSGRRYAVSRELTKQFEETIRGTFEPGAAFSRFERLRGEVVITVEGPPASESAGDPEPILRQLLDSGMKPTDAAREAASLTGCPKSQLYELALTVNRVRGQLTENDAALSPGRASLG